MSTSGSLQSSVPCPPAHSHESPIPLRRLRVRIPASGNVYPTSSEAHMTLSAGNKQTFDEASLTLPPSSATAAASEQHHHQLPGSPSSGMRRPSPSHHSDSARSSSRVTTPSVRKEAIKRLLPPSPPSSPSSSQESPVSAASSRQAPPKKPPIACLFCRGRKIACGQPPADSLDRTCK